MRIALLALIITCWSIVAFVYRWVGKRNLPPTWVAFGAAAMWFSSTLVLALVKRVAFLSAPPVLFAAGALGGASCVAALPFFMAAVARGSLAVSWTIMTLSFAAAALLCLVYPGGAASAAGVVGLVSAGIAIVLLGHDGASGAAGRGFRRGWGLFMAASFVANTLYMYAYPLAGEWAGLETLSNKMALLVTETAVFVVGSGIVCLARGARAGRLAALAAGSVIGTMFFVGNLSTTHALGNMSIPAYVFFPATTGGSTVAVALISAGFFGERPGRWGWAGLALGVAAMVLLSAAA